MKITTSLADFRIARGFLHGPVGFVPTMGYLHEGHLSLVRRARAECTSVVVSIFVNPTQFGPDEDLDRYLRDLDRDVRMLEREGADLLFAPAPDEVYPQGFQTWVTVERLSAPLEGAERPGHFRGVATIVTKLLFAVQPDRLYVGQKDAQQALVIRRLVRELNVPAEVIVCPTVREADGLAMSSRNAHLSRDERRAAVVLHRALDAAMDAYAKGERRADTLRRTMQETLAEEPLARPQYVSVADPDTLDELQGQIGEALLSLAAFVGQTRLIDNVLVGDQARDRQRRRVAGV